MSDNNICGQCGEPYELGASFCQQCGWKIPDNINSGQNQNFASAQQQLVMTPPASADYNLHTGHNSQLVNMPYQSIDQSNYGGQGAQINSQQQFPNYNYNNPGVPQGNIQKRISPLMIGVIGVVGVIVVVVGAYFISKSAGKGVDNTAAKTVQGASGGQSNNNPGAAGDNKAKIADSSNQTVKSGVVKPEDLKGNWKGSIVFTSMEGFENTADEQEINKFINKSQEVRMNIDAKPDGTGKLSFIIANEGQEASETPWMDYKFSNGKITMKSNAQDVVLSLEGGVSSGNGEIKINGNWDIVVKSIDGKTQKVRANWTVTQVSKDMPQLATVNPDGGSSREIIIQPDNPYMTVGGVKKEIDPGSGLIPYMVNGAAMIPIRAIIEEMGGAVVWKADEKKITVNFNSNVVEMWIDKNEVYVNGMKNQTAVAPKIIKNKTVLPVKFIAENLDCEVVWDAVTRSIKIKY